MQTNGTKAGRNGTTAEAAQQTPEHAEREGNPIAESRRELAQFYLLSSPTVREAAERVGVSRSTVYRWLRDPGFLKEVDELKEEIVEDGKRQLKGTLVASVQTLHKLLESENESVRRQAAKDLLTFNFRLEENEALRRRMDLLEQGLEEESVREEIRRTGF